RLHHVEAVAAQLAGQEGRKLRVVLDDHDAVASVLVHEGRSSSFLLAIILACGRRAAGRGGGAGEWQTGAGSYAARRHAGPSPNRLAPTELACHGSGVWPCATWWNGFSSCRRGSGKCWS